MSQWSSLVLGEQLGFNASWINSGHTLSVCYVVQIKVNIEVSQKFIGFPGNFKILITLGSAIVLVTLHHKLYIVTI